MGENSKVLMLTKGAELVSFCTYSEKDDIQSTEIGFVYTFPEHRGNRYMGKLFLEIKSRKPRMCMISLYQQTMKKFVCENICKEDNNISMGDGAGKIFLNANGTQDDVNK